MPENKHVYEFYSAEDDDTVEVEAESFDEACNIMFGEDPNGSEPYDYHKYELITIDGKY